MLVVLRMIPADADEELVCTVVGVLELAIELVELDTGMLKEVLLCIGLLELVIALLKLAIGLLELDIGMLEEVLLGIAVDGDIDDVDALLCIELSEDDDGVDTLLWPAIMLLLEIEALMGVIEEELLSPVTEVDEDMP